LVGGGPRVLTRPGLGWVTGSVHGLGRSFFGTNEPRPHRRAVGRVALRLVLVFPDGEVVRGEVVAAPQVLVLRRLLLEDALELPRLLAFFLLLAGIILNN